MDIFKRMHNKNVRNAEIISYWKTEFSQKNFYSICTYIAVSMENKFNDGNEVGK